MNNIPGTWQAKKSENTWQILDESNQLIATIANIPDAETKAKQIAASPYVLTALKSMVDLLGDEDMPDNGELSGAAISDMARSAVELAENQ